MKTVSNGWTATISICFCLHIPDPVTPLEETALALDAVVRKGWVRYVGFSNYLAWMAQKMFDIQNSSGQARFICAQMYYSLLGAVTWSMMWYLFWKTAGWDAKIKEALGR